MKGMTLLYSFFPLSCHPGYSFCSIFVILFFEIYKGYSKLESVTVFCIEKQKIGYFIFPYETIKGKWMIPFLLLKFILVDFF